MAYSELPYNGNYPPGVTDNDPYFNDEGECNGLGYIECFCGGDNCVCDNNGEIQCGGCSACEPSDAYDDYGDE